MKSLFFAILLSVLFIFNLSVVSAQEVSPTVSPTPAATTYQLPYPGILPGHPFYFFKSLRDKIWGVMISNPLKKAEFDLLQADKSIASAELLFKQKAEKSLIFSQLADAGTYFSEALDKSVAAKKQGMDHNDLTKRMAVANQRHQEVVLEMTKTGSKEDKEKYLSELEKIKELGKRTEKLNSQ